MRASSKPDHHVHQLRRGQTYQAITNQGITVGEYLGMEVPYGEWAILLRHGAGTESIAVSALTSIHPAT